MLNNAEFDPYCRPTPYEVLGVTGGGSATSKDIAKAFNKQKNEARLIKDVKQRAARQQDLERVKEQLQRPEDRVLLDFFSLGADLFGELCSGLSQKLAETPLPCEKIIGRLLKDGEFDDLIPRPLSQFSGEFQSIGDPVWYQDDQAARERVSIAYIDVDPVARVEKSGTANPKETTL